MENIVVGLLDPPVLVSPTSPAVMLAFFGAIAAVAVVIASYYAVVRRDGLPLVTCLGAALCSLNEPIFDILGKITYAQNSPTAFTAFDRDIPWFLVIGYIAWVGLFPYIIAVGMAAGWSRYRLYGLSIAGVLAVIGTEVVNVFVQGWQYFGQAPLNFFGGVAAMASMPLAAAFLLYTLALPQKGWRRLAAGVLAPVFALPMMFAATGWPLYLALYSDLPPILNYAAVAALLVLIWVAVLATVRLTEWWRDGGALVAKTSIATAEAYSSDTAATGK